MLVDRFSELTAGKSSDPTESIAEEELPLLGDVEIGVISMRQFLSLDQSAKHQLEDISSLLTQLRESLLFWHSTTSPAEEQALLTKTEDICEWISESVRATKRALAVLNAQVDNSNTPFHTRMRRNLHAALVTKLADRVEDFRAIQDELSQASKARAVRHIKISLNVDDAKALDLIENGVTEQSIYSNSMSTETEEELLLKLSSVRGKVSSLRRIQRSMADVNLLMTSLAELVVSQGGVLDNIEIDVVNAKNFTVSALTNLVEADKTATKKMKCMIIACIIVVVLLVVAFIVLLIQSGVVRLW